MLVFGMLRSIAVRGSDEKPPVKPFIESMRVALTTPSESLDRGNQNSRQCNRRTRPCVNEKTA